MIDDDLELVYSPLCQEITLDGKTIQVSIYGCGEGDWSLETVDEYGNSCVWDDLFETDEVAMAELNRTLNDEGIDSLIGRPSTERSQSSDAEFLPIDTGLSDEEINELDAFLMSDAVSDETMMLDCLEGFLTAIASGPVAVMPSKWLSRIWGPSSEDAPVFDTIEQAMRINSFIMQYMNGIAARLRADPEGFEPLVDVMSYPNDPREYHSGEMWAHGYMTGIDLCRQDWEEFFRQTESAEVLRPLYLLGFDDLPEDQWSLTETPQQRETLTAAIPASVAWIYRFWLPYRQALHERMVAKTYQREHPKTGRNDPCPCGSGKKFKKCCGAGATLH